MWKDQPSIQTPYLAIHIRPLCTGFSVSMVLRNPCFFFSLIQVKTVAWSKNKEQKEKKKERKQKKVAAKKRKQEVSQNNYNDNIWDLYNF